MVSELAKNHGKASGRNGSSSVSSSSAAMLAVLCLATGMSLWPVSTAEAAIAIGSTGGNYIGGGSIFYTSGASAAGGTDSIAIGNGTVATGTSVAMGSGTKAYGISLAMGAGSEASSSGGMSQGAVALGSDAKATGDQSIALGSATRAYNAQSTAIGNDAITGSIGAIVIGGDDTNGAYKFTDRASAYGIVRADKDNYSTGANYRASISSGVGSVVVGVHSQAVSHGSTAIGVMSTAGDGGTAVEINSSDTPEQLKAKLAQAVKSNTEATAIGAYSHASAEKSTALGTSAYASQRYATAIGNAATATGESSTAIGLSATAIGIDSTAVGERARAEGERAMAIGVGATGSSFGSLAFGDTVKASGRYDLAIGANTTVQSGNVGGTKETPSLAIGYGSSVGSANSTSIGANNVISGPTTGSTGVVSANSDNNVVGSGNSVIGTGNQILGNNNKINNLSSVVAIGNNITEMASNSVFLGNNTKYMGSGNFSKGAAQYSSEIINGITFNFSTNPMLGVVSVGGVESKVRRIQGVAPGLIGPQSVDAVNGSQLYSVASTLLTKIDATAGHDYSVNSTTTGTDTNYTNAGATGSNALAAGVSAGATGTAATAVGNASKAYANSGVALGDGAIAGVNGDVALGANSIAVGKTAQATAVDGIALGSSAQSLSDSAIVIGKSAKSANSAGANNIAVGSNSSIVSGTSNIAFGTGAKTGTGTSSALALGTGATIADGAMANSVAIGTSSMVQGGGVAIGTRATITDTSKTSGGNVAIGDNTKVDALEGGIAIGKSASVTRSPNVGGGIAIGQGATSAGVRSLALGYLATNDTAQEGQIAIGSQSVSAGDKAIAIGANAKTTGSLPGQLAIGYGATTSAQYGVALGTSSVADRNSWDAITGNVYVPVESQRDFVETTKAIGNAGAVSVGSNTVRRQIINVAAGSADTDAVNVAQLKALASQVGDGQNFTVGADATHAATGISITKDANRFDVVGANSGANIKTTVTSDRKGIEIDLSDSVKQTLSQVGTNTTAIQNVNQTINTLRTNAFGISADDNQSVKADLGNTIAVVGDGINISTTVENNKVKVSLDRNIDADSLTIHDTLVDGSSVTTTINKSGTSYVEANTDGLPVKEMSSSASGTSVSSYTTGTGTGTHDMTETTSQGITVFKTTNTEAGNQVVVDTKRTDVTNDGIVIKTLHGEQTNGVGGNLDNPETKIVSLTSKGLDNGGNRILNVANAETLTDAVNLGQLQEATTRYYSVKATNQAEGSNYDNKGATGDNALAAGVSASATGEAAVAVGASAKAGAKNALAVGNSAVASAVGTTAVGATSQATGVNATALGVGAKALNTSSISVGQATAEGATSLAIGAVGTIAKGASTIALGDTATTTGDKATAIGTQATATNLGVALGAEATATNTAGIAIGYKASAASTAGEAAVAIGQEATAVGNASLAFGHGASAVANYSIALGDGSSALVSDANVTVPSYTIGSETKNFAGANSYGVVSVGNSALNQTRLITNVSAGRISETSTDAINGSQLFGVITEVNKNTAATATNTSNIAQQQTAISALQKGWNVAVDHVGTGVSSDVTTDTLPTTVADKKNVQASETVTFKAGNNLVVTQDGASITYATSMTPNFTSVSAGSGANQVTLSDAGVAVGGKTYITNTGIQANNQRITGLANGLALTDAVTVGQLNDKLATQVPRLQDGKNTTFMTVTGEDGVQHAQVNLKDTVTLNTSTQDGARAIHLDATTGKVSIGNLQGTKDGNGVFSSVTDATIVADGTTGTVKAGAITLTNSEDKATVNGLTNTTWDVEASIPVHGQAATEDQLHIVSQTVTANVHHINDLVTSVDKGLNFQGDDGVVINKKMDGTLSILGGSMHADDLVDNMIGVINKNGDLHVQLNKNLDLTSAGSVTTGASTLSDTGLAVGGKTYVSATGLNANGNKITNVADGLVEAGSKEAVNGGQLAATEKKVADNEAKTREQGDRITSLEDGFNVTANGESGSKSTIHAGDTVNFAGQDNAIVSKSGNTITVAMSKTPTLDTVTVNGGSATGGNTVISNAGVTITPNTGDAVSLTATGLNNGNQKITNVADGLVAAGSKEAVTGGQLNTVKTQVDANQQAISTLQTGWTLDTNKTGSGNVSGNQATAVTAGTKVTLVAGNNITATQAGTNVTFALNDKVELGSGANMLILDGTNGTITGGASASSTVLSLNAKTGNAKIGNVAINNDRSAEGTPKATITGLTNTTYGGTDFATRGRAATEEQLQAMRKQLADLVVGEIQISQTKMGDGVNTSYVGEGTSANPYQVNVNTILTNMTEVQLGKSGSHVIVNGEGLYGTKDDNFNVGTFEPINMSEQIRFAVNGVSAGSQRVDNVKSAIADGSTTPFVQQLEAAMTATNDLGGTRANSAVIVSDLKHAVDYVKSSGLDFVGNDGTKVHRDLGTQLSVTGGLTNTATDVSAKNLGVRAKVENGVATGLEVVMSEKPSFATVTAGSTTPVVMGDSGVSVGGKTYLTTDGINANNQQITGVKDGVLATDAATVGQVTTRLAEQAASFQDGKNTTFTTTTAQDGTVTRHVDLKDNVTLNASTTDGAKAINLDATTGKLAIGNIQGTKDANGVYTAVTDATIMADGTTGTIKAGAITLTNSESTATVNGLTNRTWEVGTSVAVSGQAATEDQLQVVSQAAKLNADGIQAINTTLGKGLNFQGDAGEKINKTLDSTLSIVGGVSNATDLVDNQIGVMNTAGALRVQLKKNLDLTSAGSVTTGATVLNNTGLAVDGKTYVSANGLDANGKKVMNVLAGTVAPGSTDAVNGSQLAETNAKLATNSQTITSQDGRIQTLEGGFNVTANGATATQSVIKAGDTVNFIGRDNAIVSKEGNTVVVAMSKNPVLDTLVVNGGITSSTSTTVTADGVTIKPSSSDPTKSVSLTKDGLDNGGNTITNVGEGSVSANSTDAVNGKQLFEVKTQVEANKETIRTNTESIHQLQGGLTANTETINNHTNEIAQLQKGWNVATAAVGTGVVTGGAKTANVQADQTVTFTASDNIVFKQTDRNIEIATSLTPQLTSVMVGNEPTSRVAVSDSGIKIGSRTYITKDGLNAQNQQIKQVLDGVAPTDAVNVKQLEEAKTRYFSVEDAGDDPKLGNYGNDGATGTHAVAIGVNASAPTANSVALGANSKTDTVVATTSMTVNGVTYGTSGANVIAGTAPEGTVSVGDVGKEKTITNVAAGRVSSTSTDAINGSQLFAVTKEIDKGISYKGNTGESVVKLGSAVNIVGTGTGSSAMYSSNNIMTTVDPTAGTLTINMKKQPDFEKVTAGTAADTKVTIGDAGVTVGGKTYIQGGTTPGMNANDNKIINVADGNIVENSKDAVNAGQLYTALNSMNSSATGGFGLIDDAGTVVKQDLGKQIQLTGTNGITVKADTADDKKVMKIGFSNELTVGSKDTTAAGSTMPGEDGKITTQGKDGSSVVVDGKDATVTATGANGASVSVNGKDGSIGMAGADGKNAVTIQTATGVPDVAGANVNGAGTTRITYNDGTTTRELATMNDGMIYAGDNGQTDASKRIVKQLNQTVDIVGGATGALSDNNIGVNNVDGKLKVQLAKTITGIDKITMIHEAADPKDGSKVTLDGVGLRITPLSNIDENGNEIDNSKVVSINSNGNNSINAGSLHITNISSAIATQAGNNFAEKLDASAAPNSLVKNNAVTITDLKQLSESILKGADKKGAFGLADDKGATIKANLGETVPVVGDKSVVTQVVTEKDASGNTVAKALQVGLANSVTIGQGPDPADVNKPVADGELKVIGKNGQTAVALTGTGLDGDAGADGRIVLGGREGDSNYYTIQIRTERGMENTPVDLDGNSISRIIYNDGNRDYAVATLADGMMYGGDVGETKTTAKVIKKKLNEQVNVIGGITSVADLTTTNNIGVVSDGANNLHVRLAKELTGLSSVETKDGVGNTSTLDGSGVYMEDGTKTNVNAISSNGMMVQNGDKVTVFNGEGVKVSPTTEGGKVVTLTSAGLDNGGNKIVNVKDGLVAEGSTDAVNGGQLYAVTQDLATVKDTVAAHTEKLAEHEALIGQNTKDIAANKEAIATNAAAIAENKTAIQANTDAIQANTDKISQLDTNISQGLNYAADSGNEFNRQLGSKVTIKGGQTDAAKLTDNNIGVVSNGADTLTVKLAKHLTGLESVSAQTVHVGDTTITTDGLKINNGPSVTKSGIDAGNKQVTNVASGLDGKKVSEVSGDALKNAVNVADLKEVANTGITFEGDKGTAHQAPIGSTVAIKGDGSSVVTTMDGNTLKISVASAQNFGDIAINKNDSNTITGLSNKKIDENFADGSGRAATEEQVKEAVVGLGGAVSNAMSTLKDEIADTGAHAAALAALKPMQYDPLEPTQIMAGVGGYRGSHSLALGVAHYKNESTMFHAGLTLGSSNNMYNAGVTWKLGSHEKESAVPEKYKAGPISSVYVMQDEMTEVKAQNAQLMTENAEQKEKLAAQQSEIELMKAQIQLLMSKVGL